MKLTMLSRKLSIRALSLKFSEMHDVPIEQAMEIFYTSELLPLLEDGVADLHCRSNKYLAEEIWREFCEKK